MHDKALKYVTTRLMVAHPNLEKGLMAAACFKIGVVGHRWAFKDERLVLLGMIAFLPKLALLSSERIDGASLGQHLLPSRLTCQAGSEGTRNSKNLDYFYPP